MLSQKAVSGVAALVGLIELHLDTKVPVNVSDLSEHTGISVSYLEQLFAKLKRAGLITGVRGPGGGYLPTEQARDATVRIVVEAIDGVEDFREYRPGSGLLTHLREAVYKHLDGIEVDSILPRRAA